MSETENRENETESADAAAAGEPAAEASPEPAEAGTERDFEGEIAELNDKLLRTLAEMENLRRRAQRDREDASKYAIAGFARDVLEVSDNLNRALESVASAPDGADALSSLQEGVALTERALLGVMERHGVEKIEPMGEKFDSNLHEAMFEVPTAEAPPGTVVQVIQTGYVISGRLLRPAKVGIARHPPEAPPPPESVDTTV